MIISIFFYEVVYMDYKVFYERDISYANVKRYVYYVGVSEELEDKELKKVFKVLNNELKKPFKKAYENVTVFFFHSFLDYQHGSSFARVEKINKKGQIVLERR